MLLCLGFPTAFYRLAFELVQHPSHGYILYIVLSVTLAPHGSSVSLHEAMQLAWTSVAYAMNSQPSALVSRGGKKKTNIYKICLI